MKALRMKQLLSLLGSMKSMALLMLIFAFSIGYATFIENDYGTITAKAEVYNARWFEVLLGLLALNLLLNIYNFKMYTLKKAPIFIFHAAFLVILVGAAITRYVGFEGTMHIREGLSSDFIISSDSFITLNAQSEGVSKEISEAVYLSKRGNNAFHHALDVSGKRVEIELTEYIHDAMQSIVEDPSGKPIAQMMVTSSGMGEAVVLKEGESFESDSIVIDFNSNASFAKPVIKLSLVDGKLMMTHTEPLQYMKMDDGSKGELGAQTQMLESRTLYTMEGSSFVLRNFYEKAVTKIVSNPNAKAKSQAQDVLRFSVSVGEESQEIMVSGKAGVLAQAHSLELGGVNILVGYGSKMIKLPFEVKLLDFQLERYPGSMSPSSYASEVELIDRADDIHMPYRIYMNNILEHKNYRFFQASYDQDELGTVLSVNHDPGTLPSYIGYALLALGMFWSLFSRENRFAKLSERAKKHSLSAGAFAAALIVSISANTSLSASELDPSIKTIVAFDISHAKKFGELVVQDSGGRMKPLDTLANEILTKMYKSNHLSLGDYTLDANQVILGMMIRPDIYRDMKIIYTKDQEINKIIGVKIDAKSLSFGQFFEDPLNMRGYKLAQYVEEAVRKEPKYRNTFDKAVLKVDERVNIAYMVFTGSLVRIWPKPNDENNKWFATIDALSEFDIQEGEKVRAIAIDYFNAVDGALQSGKWDEADKALAKIAEYQSFYGHEVYPSQSKIAAETLYNEANIFERLFPLYLVVGFVLLILSFVKILKPSFNLDIYTKLSLGLLGLFFIAHTFGLGLRWYISGHAPWSDGYESMIYIAWATVLAGFIFSKRSGMTVASTGILTALILFVAHLNWMDPQVTNLVPVLNSYWLSIHVSMITASYGFLGLGALLGFIVIILFIMANPANKERIASSIKELNAINEMTLMVGLVLLTIGNFLGGVWANESWGRYWGWDPKETWALVTILVYAVVVHIRFIKPIYSEFNFAVISLLSFTSVLMTYFGVNYYLAGMHSYAKGDPVPVPDFVPITYFIIFLAIVLASRHRKIA